MSNWGYTSKAVYDIKKNPRRTEAVAGLNVQVCVEDVGFEPKTDLTAGLVFY
jgi:hypothetical protein